MTYIDGFVIAVPTANRQKFIDQTRVVSGHISWEGIGHQVAVNELLTLGEATSYRIGELPSYGLVTQYAGINLQNCHKLVLGIYL